MDIPTELELHQKFLTELCRICGAKRSRTLELLPCAPHKEAMLTAFLVNITKDSPAVHPTNMCTNCTKAMKRYNQQLDRGKGFLSTISVMNWFPHKDVTTCTTCKQYHEKLKGGRRAKKGKHPGPHTAPTTSRQAIIHQIQAVAPRALCSKEATSNRSLFMQPPSLELFICSV